MTANQTGAAGSPDARSAVTAPLSVGPFSGPTAFAQIVRDTFARAAEAGWREIVVSDASFADWPLGERAVVQSLQDWARAGRRFTMLARQYDDVARRHARFVSWRRTWAHLIDCRRCAQADPLELPSAIWTPAWALRRLDLDRSPGVCGSEPERRLQIRETLDEWLRQSTPGLPASTLGL